MENRTGSYQLRGCNEIIWWKRWQVAINWVHVFINYISILENTKAEVFAIKAEDFTTASNRKFIHAFYMLIASNYIFNLLYAIHYIVVYSMVFRKSSNFAKIYWQCGTLFMAFRYLELQKAIKITLRKILTFSYQKFIWSMEKFSSGFK